MLKKATITILISFALLIAYILGLNIIQPRVAPIRTEDIESIVLVSGSDQSVKIISSEQLKAFTQAFNQSRHYRNNVGTTPPARVDAMFKDGIQMTVWGYNQNFATLKFANGMQQNIRGKALQEWFRQIIAGQA